MHKTIELMRQTWITRTDYATKAPLMVVEFLGVRKSGKGRTGKYAIRLGRILKIKRWR